jgi:hypothetical protein
MVSYDTTQIALFVSFVLTVAGIGIALVLGVLARMLISDHRVRPAQQRPQGRFHGRLAFHH